jgi:predicted ATP-grasp superfamily ATP-dependent carboligase
VPSVAADPTGFAAAVRRELSTFSYLTALPMTEAVLMALDLPIRPLISKVATAAAAARAGIPTPPSRVFASAQDLRDAAGELAYPVVIKPDIKTRLAMRADDAASVRSADLADGTLVTQPFLKEQLRGVLGLMWQGRLVSAVHMRYERIWPTPCGTVASGQTVSVDVELEAGLERLLSDYSGIFHVDLAGAFLLDLNPRVHAAVTLGVAAGVNIVAQYCDLLRGTPVAPMRAKPGVRYRWLEGDVRSLFHAARRGDISWSATLRELAPRPRTAYSIEDMRDPRPSLERLLQIGARATRSLHLRRGGSPLGSPQGHPITPIGPSSGR